MFSRTMTRSYELPVPPDAVWDHLTDPAAVAAAATHDLRVDEPPTAFRLGTRWDEQHGPECGGDVVRWSVVALEPGRSFTIESRQSGARQRVTTVLTPIAAGTRVETTMHLRPSLRARGGPAERVGLLLVLSTGLGLAVLTEQFDESVADDLAHFGVDPARGDQE